MKKIIDCSLIKGANYTPSYARNDVEEWRDYDEKVVERELGYASRIGFNSVRVFLNYVVYAHNKEKFLKNVLHMVRYADSVGIKVMPVIFNSCFSEKEPTIDMDVNEWLPSPGVKHLGEDFFESGEQYCLDLINLLKNENGLLMWDVMNEPLFTDYVIKYTPEISEQHKQEIYKFLKHFCDFFKKHDEINPITVGQAFVSSTEEICDWVDILSYHDYLATNKCIEESLLSALELSKRTNKQIICSEMGCPGRGNPYDVTIETVSKHNVGYFIWELMIGRSFWNDRHGVVYTDGTIRDASIIAAVNGFYRRRENRIAYKANVEGNVEQAVKRAEEWLNSTNKEIEEGLEVLNHFANLLEGNQLVAECDLPSSTYISLKKNKNTSIEDIKTQIEDWMKILKKEIN